MPTSEFRARLGIRFIEGAESLFTHIKTLPVPCLNSESELADSLGGISVRTVRRYLRFLRISNRIEIKYTKFRYQKPPRGWFNRREIFVVEE